uniref:Uncharacterized protein n=1 Tax=Setaria digitata TaxID=48799 RepID=A0A915PXH5_9BILA
MCLYIRKKEEVRLGTQPAHSILQVQTKNPVQKQAIKKSIEHDGTPLSREELKSKFEELQKALGAEPNSALIDRIHSWKQPLKDLSVKKGDLVFSLKKIKKVSEKSGGRRYGCKEKESIKVRKNEGNADDDTVYPKLEISKNGSSEDEVNKELDGLAEPGELSLMKSAETLRCDPYAPIEELEKRGSFNCQTLRRNTFLANTLSMPNAKERKAISKPKSARKVTFDENVYDITDWEEFAWTAEEQSEKTQMNSELELEKTQNILPITSKETVERLSEQVMGPNHSLQVRREHQQQPFKIGISLSFNQEGK